LADCSRCSIVERHNFNHLPREQSHKADLTRAVPPDLRDHTRGDGQSVPALERPGREYDNLTSCSLERDQRS
jgi:hypothetical protein